MTLSIMAVTTTFSFSKDSGAFLLNRVEFGGVTEEGKNKKLRASDTGSSAE